MHTFNIDADGTVTVGRLERRRVGDIESDEFVSVRKFTDLSVAIAFINVLSGGSAGSNYIKFILKLSTPC